MPKSSRHGIFWILNHSNIWSILIPVLIVLAVLSATVLFSISVSAQTSDSGNNDNTITPTDNTSDQAKKDAKTGGGMSAKEIRQTFFAYYKEIGKELTPATPSTSGTTKTTTLPAEPPKTDTSGIKVSLQMPPATTVTREKNPNLEILMPPAEIKGYDGNDRYNMIDAPVIAKSDQYKSTVTIVPVAQPSVKTAPLVMPTISPIQPPVSGSIGGLGIDSQIAGSVAGYLNEGKTFAKEALDAVSQHHEVLYLLLILFITAIVAQMGGWRIGFISLMAMMLMAAGVKGAAGVTIIPTYVVFIVVIVAISLVVLTFTRMLED